MVRGRGSAVVLIAAVLVGLFAFTWVTTPSTEDIQQRVAAFTAAHRVRVLQPAEVPSQLAQAVVATEDERFYEHHGLDVVGLGRALLFDVRNVCLCEGGSTITQQLAKVIYLAGDDRGFNKLRDMVLALKVERVIGKPQILADYLSVVYAGQGKWGVAAAACTYFHVPLAKLDLPEFALLAGLPQAPSVYDPLVNPTAALRRRTEVLNDMLSHGFITSAQFAAASKAPLVSRGRRLC